MDRAYTVREVDALRDVLEHKYLFGTYRSQPAPVVTREWEPIGGGICTAISTGATSRPYREEDKARVVEEMVRTHMLAGHTADDLLDSEPVK